jgi:hypothetical protein
MTRFKRFVASLALVGAALSASAAWAVVGNRRLPT